MKPSKFNKDYKALMLDIDGTLIPYDHQALPSQRIKEAINKAQEKIIVCLVTGRAYNFAEEILNHLGVNKGYIVINNGANVINISTKEVIYDCPMDLTEAKTIVKILRKNKIPFYVKENYFFKLSGAPHFNKESFDKAYMIYTDEDLSAKKVDTLLEEFSNLLYLNAHRSRHKFPNRFGIVATHVNATKTQGILALEKKIKIKKIDMIGVGDGYNDFPLLMACGLKIAMGNAIPELKEIADYIAPTVEKDGVADIIEKFVLKNEK